MAEMPELNRRYEPPDIEQVLRPEALARAIQHAGSAVITVDPPG
jgi:hypothetical protein